MPYKTGAWGKQAKIRSKTRLEYFAKYSKFHYNYNAKKYEYNAKKYEYEQQMGCSIPKNVDLTSLLQNKKCQLCGKLPMTEKFKGLLIHHKDENPNNNVLDNLIILCKGCHNKIHHEGRKLSKESKKKMRIARIKYLKRKRGEEYGINARKKIGRTVQLSQKRSGRIE